MTRPYPQMSPFVLARGEATAGGGGTTAGVALPFKGALVKLTADESLANATLLAIPWDAEVYDEGGFWVIGSPTRLTVPEGVTKIRLTGNLGILSGLTADRILVRIKKNGDLAQTFQTAQDIDPITGAPTISFSTPVFEVVATDYFEMMAFQDSGGALSIDAAGVGGETRTFFGIEAIEATAPSSTYVGALVKITAAEALVTTVPVDWDAIIYDSSDFWEGVTNPERLTVPAGITHVKITAGFGMSTSVADQQFYIAKNGARVEGGGWSRDGVSEQADTFSSAVIEVVEGDYFTFIPEFGAGSPVMRSDVVGGSWFAIEAIKQAVVSGRPSLLHVRDEKAAGTNGGASSVTTWHTRTLNTELTNEISGASLASNQITLGAGTYEIKASAPAFKVSRHKLKLRDTTGAADILIGQSTYTADVSSVVTHARIVGRFTLAVTSVLELQHYTELAVASNGLGVETNAAVTEVYAEVMIEKVA